MSSKLLSVLLSQAYVPPMGSAVATGQTSLSMQYEEQVSGQIDVPADTASATVYTIEFGTVALLKCLLVKNGLAEPVGIRFGSAVANEFVVGPGGVLAVAMPTAPASGGLAAMKVVTTDEASADGAIEYLIFGDPTPVS